MRNALIVALLWLLIAPDSEAAWFHSVLRPYEAPVIAPIQTSDSPRLAQLIRAGNIYLSLADLIDLSLENNVDMESQRYNPQIADADLLRARAGGLIRGVSTSISQGPSSASGVLAGQNLLGGGSTSGNSSNAGVFSGITIQGLGTSIPVLDPVLSFNAYAGHTTQPLTSVVVAGTTALVSVNKEADFQAQKGFLTGTSVAFGFYNNNNFQNSPNNITNPSLYSTMALSINQHLLQGFGRAVNGRDITIAKNDRELSDLVFRQQAITTVSSAIGLYYDLVTLRENQRVRQEALAISEKLLADNKTRVSIGALAPIEIVRAEAEVARDQQSLIDAETQVLEQETIVKNFVTRSEGDDPLVLDAHIIPTDQIRTPEDLPVQPIQDLFGLALNSRPEIKQDQISITNTRESMRGTKNGLLPFLDVYANLQNHGLAGTINNLAGAGAAGAVDPFFLGGYGSVLSQLFSRNFPDYTVGVQLTIPLRNRQAQADYIRDELTLRQQQLADLKERKQVRADVQNGLIALRQAKAAYDLAVKSKVLAEKTLDAQHTKFTYGSATLTDVILVQRDLTTAQSTEASALNNYEKARVQFDQALGRTLEVNRVSIAEAASGRISRPPSPLPPVTAGQGVRQ
jgi:outer membrane protein TolC